MSLKIFIKKDIGLIHISGIGGIGMSAMAEILHNSGYKVQGSDIANSKVIERLRSIGISVFIGQSGQYLTDVKIIVRSSAIREDNPELRIAKDRKIPIISRAKMLAEIMKCNRGIAISGTHGKTTTTALVAHLLKGLDPTVINGGIINDVQTNAYIGQGEHIIVEADESDGTFIQIPYEVAVVTNIDPEHLEYYNNDFEKVKQAYNDFLCNIPFYGAAILCIDDQVLRTTVFKVFNDHDANLYRNTFLTYGFSEDANLRIIKVSKTNDSTIFDFTMNGQIFYGVHLPLLGEHNVLNACAAILVAVYYNIPISEIVANLSTFSGVQRRFTIVSTNNNITVVDDYAHHPVEIKKTILSAKQRLANTSGRLIVVLQPHRYSRVYALMDEFAECLVDAEILMISEIYSAGESKILGINSEVLIRRIADLTGKDIYHTPSFEDVQERLRQIACPDDLILMLGAGDITKWAAELSL